MPDPASRSGDFDPGDGEPPYEWLDEWLCEYVDGAMDPSLEAVFEQYVEANPKLKAHVERLCETRELLANASTTDPTSADAPTPDRPPHVPVPPDAAPPERTASEPMISATLGPVAVLSSVAAALAIGFLAGTLFVGASSAPSTPEARPAASHTSPPAPTRSAAAPVRAPRQTDWRLPIARTPTDSSAAASALPTATP